MRHSSSCSSSKALSCPGSSVLRNGSLALDAVACCAYWPLGIRLKVQAAFVFIRQVGYSSPILSSFPIFPFASPLSHQNQWSKKFSLPLAPLLQSNRFFEQSSVQLSNHLDPAHRKPNISGYEHKMKFISWILPWVCLLPPSPSNFTFAGFKSAACKMFRASLHLCQQSTGMLVSAWPGVSGSTWGKAEGQFQSHPGPRLSPRRESKAYTEKKQVTQVFCQITLFQKTWFLFCI